MSRVTAILVPLSLGRAKGIYSRYKYGESGKEKWSYGRRWEGAYSGLWEVGEGMVGCGGVATRSLTLLKFSPSCPQQAASPVSSSSQTGIVVYTNALAWKLV